MMDWFFASTKLSNRASTLGQSMVDIFVWLLSKAEVGLLRSQSRVPDRR